MNHGRFDVVAAELRRAEMKCGVGGKADCLEIAKLCSQEVGSTVKLRHRLTAPKRFLEIGYALNDRDLDGLHVLPEEQDWVHTMLGAVRDGGMEDRDPGNAGPVPPSHRGAYFGPDHLCREDALDDRRAALERLDGRVVVAEADAACLHEQSHEPRKRNPKLVGTTVY